ALVVHDINYFQASDRPESGAEQGISAVNSPGAGESDRRYITWAGNYTNCRDLRLWRLQEPLASQTPTEGERHGLLRSRVQPFASTMAVGQGADLRGCDARRRCRAARIDRCCAD